MARFEGENIIAIGNGVDGLHIEGTADLKGVHSSGSGRHGVYLGPQSDVKLKGATLLDNKGAGLMQEASVVEKARASGVIFDLTDDELFKALQAIRVAAPEERADVLKAGALWASYAKAGLDITGALASVYSVLHAAGAM